MAISLFNNVFLRIISNQQVKLSKTMSEELSRNPFLETYQTPHQTVPFDQITLAHFEPAIREGMKRQDAEIDAIVSNPDKPTFQNTIVPFEKSGSLLDRCTTVFENLLSAETSDEMQNLAQTLFPVLTDHSNNIGLNKKLFQRIQAVYKAKDKAGLGAEDLKLLEDIYTGFVRNGANLTAEKKKTFRKISKQLSVLSLRFNNNLLKETNAFRLTVTEPDRLSGLPSSAIEAAAETARQFRIENGWVFTLNAPSYVPFMMYADDRQLRQQMYMAYNTKGTHDNTENNFKIVEQLVNLRLELAQLLGYHSYADYALEHRMAEKKEAVYHLFDQLLEAYLPAAEQELKEVATLAQAEQGPDFKLMPWDWSYYSQKLKQKKFSFDSENLRPYFELSRVIKGVFGLATRLYGISFKLNKKIPVYHPDVKAYEVYDQDGRYLAVLYADFHPRATKQSGAWMTNYKGQWQDVAQGENSRPHVSLVMNFTKPTKQKPALLSLNEVETFLHEFGHSLHGIFANTTYQSLSGTNVYWDFVELPSQFMENFAVEKKFLDTFARHYQTKEPIPDDLIRGIVDTRNFNCANACLRQVSLGLLDMAWYTLDQPFHGNVIEFERQAWKPAILLPQVDGACMSTQFSHIFAGGYSAGYYSYKWAEVLDADAFSLFKEKGIFSKKTAASFRENILSKGGTEHPMELYKRFRKKEPTIDALLKRNGIIK